MNERKTNEERKGKTGIKREIKKQRNIEKETKNE